MGIGILLGRPCAPTVRYMEEIKEVIGSSWLVVASSKPV